MRPAAGELLETADALLTTRAVPLAALRGWNANLARAQLEQVAGRELMGLVEEFVREVASEAARAEVARLRVAPQTWYPVKEAARRLGVSEAAVRMRARRGRLLARRQGRRVYVSAASVDGLEPRAG